MSKPQLGIAVAVLLAVVLIQTIVLMNTPLPADGTTTAAHADKETVAQRLSPFGPVANLTYDADRGLFRATVGGQIVYVTANGDYLLAGDLYDLRTQENLSESIRAQQRVQTLSALPEGDAIVFTPKGETKASVWVFTDVTCPYCQKFHSQIDDYLARGIEVRYLAFPRGGPHSNSWRLAQSVWCAENPRAALTHAKQNPAQLELEACDSAHIREQYQAGIDVGLRGTPLIVTTDGRTLGGYLPPAALAKRLHLGG